MLKPLSQPPKKPVQSVFVASAAQGAINLPVFLMGAMVVLIRADFPISETQLGMASSLYFASAVAFSVPAGHVTERMGASKALAVTIALTALSLGATASFVQNYWSLLAGVAIGGLAAAMVQPAANMCLARAIPMGRQGIAFGVKQAAVPASTIVVGLLIPVVAVNLGWQWAYALSAGILLPMILWAWRLGLPPRKMPTSLSAANATRSPARQPSAGGTHLSAVPRWLLVYLSVAAGLALACASVLGAFYVDYVVTLGHSPSEAGGALAIGGAAGVVGRLTMGFLADRIRTSPLAMTAGAMALGSLGFVGLAVASSTTVLYPATMVCFALGWGWNGLFHLATVQMNSAAPAVATGITSVGMRTGGVAGPLAFGAIAESLSYALAWRLGAGAMFIASLMIFHGWRVSTRLPI